VGTRALLLSSLRAANSRKARGCGQLPSPTNMLSPGLDDFISPAAACTVKPMQIERIKRSHVLQLEGIDEKLTAMTPATAAKVTLNDCLACSGCITSAETVLVYQQSMEELQRARKASSTRHFVLSVSPAARAALSVHYGLGLKETFERISGLFKVELGVDTVLDCGLASDLCLVQMAAEFVERFQAHAQQGSPSEAASSTRLPILSSSCPGWICYAEKTQPHVLTHLSCVKSPQQIAGTLVKYVYGAMAGVPPDSVYHVTLMPCYDKKLEASRDDFFNGAVGEHGSRDVDCVLSSTEIATLLEECSTRLTEVTAIELDAQPPFSSLSDTGHAFCVTSPGASGGGAEYVFRRAAVELFGVQLPAHPLEWKAGRNKDLQELCLTVEGRVVLKFAKAYGFRNIQNIVRRVKNGTCAYHYVELMACPGGCANGGGQPKPPPLELSLRAGQVEARYVSAVETTLRQPEDNPQLQRLYAAGGFLEGGPLGERARGYLHTGYHDRNNVVVDNSLAIRW